MQTLKERRRRLGLSQVQLATLAGVDDSTISRTERGLTEPGPLVLKVISEALERAESDRAHN
jgi:transcriptional regulator with XRE-family HTH domain